MKRGGTANGGGRALRTGLVGTQVVLSTILVVAAALLGNSLVRLTTQDLGYSPSDLVSYELTLPGARYASHGEISSFYTTLYQNAAATPGIAGATVASAVPFGSASSQSLAYTVLNRADDGSEPPMAQYRRVGPGFFRLLSVPILEGRGIRDSDRLDAPGVVVLNERLARLAFPNEDSIGQTIELTSGNFGPRSAILVDEVEVVGVVADVHFDSPATPPGPTLYLSYQQAPFPDMHVIISFLRRGGRVPCPPSAKP